MSGRGDNNKNGSAGRGASKQSNQAFGQAAPKGKSSRSEQTGHTRSMQQPKRQDQSANRNTSTSKK